jgi:hypothetical protein
LIEQGLSKLPVYEGAVYRGMIIKRKEFEKAFAGDEGTIVCHNRFVSTSRDTRTALEFSMRKAPKNNEIRVFMEITSKTGRDISRISEKNGIFDPENQQEVLFTANTRFKIVSKRNEGNIVHLKLVEL